MSKAKVILKRTLSDGLLAEIRVYLPSDAPGQPPVGYKLQFVNDRASMNLPVGTMLYLMWELNGLEGDEMKIEAQALGIDDDFKEVVAGIAIPDDGNPTNFGERLNVRGAAQFMVGEAGK